MYILGKKNKGIRSYMLLGLLKIIKKYKLFNFFKIVTFELKNLKAHLWKNVYCCMTCTDRGASSCLFQFRFFCSLICLKKAFAEGINSINMS